jgi:hypothetical protein
MNPAALILIAALISSQDTGAMKTQAGAHQHEVNKNGDKAMGFSHMKTTHHFILKAQGGVIQVDANSKDDKESRDQIQSHLGHIARMFADGNFNTPMLVHSVTPPGTAAMTKLKADIRYTYEASATGGRVVISTSNKEALAAIHEFLRFQIKDHATGDPLTIQPAK